MKHYDTTFIIDGTLDTARREAIIEKHKGVLERHGGTVNRVVRWGLRELSYPINKKTHGYYVIFYFDAEPSVIKQLESEMRLDEGILRYMSLIYDGKHPDYIRDESAPEDTGETSPATVGESDADETPDNEEDENASDEPAESDESAEDDTDDDTEKEND